MDIEKRALFLDLDHTLIKPSSGNVFPETLDDWEFIPEVIEFAKRLKSYGYYLVIVTNQGGIESGYITEKEFHYKARVITDKLDSFFGLKLLKLFALILWEGM